MVRHNFVRRLVKLMKMMTSIRWAIDFDTWKPTWDEFVLASRCIQLEEKERIGKFVFQRDVKASLLGRILLRTFAAQSSSIPYNVLNFKRDDHGKPYCSDIPAMSFSVSHHGKYSVLAGQTVKRTVGVDIMTTQYHGGKNLSEFFRLMNRLFGEKEWDKIRGAGTEFDQMTMFNRHWALKESYVKATGTGIIVDLQTIQFEVKTPLNIGTYAVDTSMKLAGEKVDWIFHETLLDSDHILAVALEPGPPVQPEMFTTLRVCDLLKKVTPLLPEDLPYCQEFFKKDEKP